MTKTGVRLLLLFGVIVAITATAGVDADKIHLKGGRVIEGTIVEKTDAGVRLRKKFGEITYRWSEIERIEEGALGNPEYAKRLEKTDPEDPESVADLARWCEEQDLKTEARKHWDEVIALDPDHEEAREARGFVRTKDGRWVTGTEAKRLKKEEKEKKKATEREVAKKEEYEGVPWADAFPIESEHYTVTCNASREVAERYSSVMESAYDGFYEFFKKIQEPGEAKSQVFILRNYDDFLDLTQRPGIAGFYTPQGSLNIPARTVVAYHGGFGATGTTDEVLLHEATHQFEHLVQGQEFWNAPIWLIEGLAVFFEASRIEKGKVVYREGDGNVGIVPRMRLAPLQQGIKIGKHIPLKILIRTPQFGFGGYHYAHGWSLVYWMLNADGGKYRTIFESLWRNSRERRVPPEEFEEMIERETGHKLGEFEEKVWKPYVLALEAPPTGVIRRGRFTSADMKFEIKSPGRGWKWETENLPTIIQFRLKNPKIDGTIDMQAQWTEVSNEDLREKGRDGVFKELAENRRNAILEAVAYDEEKIKEEELTLAGYRAIRFEYIVGGSDPDEEDLDEEKGEEEDGEAENATGNQEEEEDEQEEEGTLNFLVFLPTVERHYTMRGSCPAKHAEKMVKDFDKFVRTFKVLP